MMQRLTTSAIAGCALALILTASVGFAQEPHHSKISIVHQGVGRLKGDLKALVDLTNETEQEQWANLKDYLDLLALGVDESRPLRVDVMTGIQPTAYVIWIPYVDGGLADLRDNLDSFGFVNRKDAQDPNLFKIQPPDQGWLRVIDGLKYVVLVFTTPADDALLKQIVIKAGDPIPDVKYLLDTKASVGAQLINSEATPEAQKKRHDAFAELRANSMDAVQKRPTETESEYELRRSALAHQLNELERLMVEAERVQAWIKLEREGGYAALQFIATAIPETSLAKAVAGFNAQPDAFASVQKLPESALSVRINHPIDEMRQTHVKEFLDLLNTDIHSRVEASEKLSRPQKDATLSLFTGIADLVRAGVATGYINAFLESKPDGNGQFISVGAVSLPDAKKLVEILPQLSTAHDGNTVELDIDKVGEIAIHRVALAEGYVELLDKLFGAKQELFIGTAENHVWMASGTGALELLKSTIEGLGEPAENPKALHADIHLFPWVSRLKEIADKEPEPENPEERQQWRDNLLRLKQAVDAMPENDEWTFDMSVADNTVSGSMTFSTGILRFVGKQISEFSKENLSE
ncbi:MAG: hypothetical protein R3C19_23660 [Planctomycetaceae bacterium]